MPCHDFLLLPQGELTAKQDGVAIVAVHDIGSNHKSIVRFTSLPCMEDICSQALFVHICLPGQDKEAEDFGATFPSMQVYRCHFICLSQGQLMMC